MEIRSARLRIICIFHSYSTFGYIHTLLINTEWKKHYNHIIAVHSSESPWMYFFFLREHYWNYFRFALYIYTYICICVRLCKCFCLLPIYWPARFSYMHAHTLSHLLMIFLDRKSLTHMTDLLCELKYKCPSIGIMNQIHACAYLYMLPVIAGSYSTAKDLRISMHNALGKWHKIYVKFFLPKWWKCMLRFDWLALGRWSENELLYWQELHSLL